MRVPKYYDTEARRRRIEVKVRDVVENIDEDIVSLQHVGLSDSIGPRAFVVVATHHGDWSQTFERFNNLRVSDIACVDNEIAAAKKGDRLRPQETVGIGDEANA